MKNKRIEIRAEGAEEEEDKKGGCSGRDINGTLYSIGVGIGVAAEAVVQKLSSPICRKIGLNRLAERGSINSRWYICQQSYKRARKSEGRLDIPGRAEREREGERERKEQWKSKRARRKG